MSDTRVTVKISNKTGYILNESSSPLEKNNLEELIEVVRETQQKTNACLTALVKETGLAASAEEKSDVSDQELDSDSEDDIEIVLAADTEAADVSPKRAKLKN